MVSAEDGSGVVLPNGLGGIEAVGAHIVNRLVRDDITELLRECCRVDL